MANAPNERKNNVRESCTEKKQLKYSGLELTKEKVSNNLAHGVIEPVMSKIKSLRFAIEAAIKVLRIDDMIKLT